tara:strand:- start:2889 stop:4313 length:1425 start_codon:yes stop_codon:yes gene_type:complete
MTFTSTILRNIKILTAAQIIASVAGLFSSALLARALGTDGFGVLGFGTAFLSLLGIAASLSTDTYGTRQIARNPIEAGTIASPILGLRLTLSVLAYAVFIVIVLTLDRNQTEKTVLLVQAGGIFVSVFILDFVFQGLERMGINGLRQISTALITLICIYLFVRAPDDLLTAAIIPVAAGSIAVGVIWFYARSNINGIKLSFARDRWRQILAVSLPMAVSGVMHTIIFNTDAVMLGLMSTNEQTGLYVSAFKIVGLTMIPAGLLIAPFFPSLSAGWEDQQTRFDRSRTFAISVLIVSLPLVVFIAIYPELILRTLFGQAYSGAGTTLLILMASMAVMHLRIIYGHPLVAWNEERFHMVATLIGAALNVMLNFILIPDYGIVGAAYASLIGHAVISILIAYKFYTKASTMHVSVIGRAGLCMAAAAAGVWWLSINYGDSFEQSFYTLIVNGIIFGGIYVAMITLVFRPNLKQILKP